VNPRRGRVSSGARGALGFALLLAGCGPGGDSASGIVLDWQLRPDPPAVGIAVFSFTLTDTTEGGGPVQGAEIRVEGNMSHAGMKPVLADAREEAPGRYRADLELTMGGDWFLLIEAQLPDGRTLSRQVDVPGVRSR